MKNKLLTLLACIGVLVLLTACDPQYPIYPDISSWETIVLPPPGQPDAGQIKCGPNSGQADMNTNYKLVPHPDVVNGTLPPYNTIKINCGQSWWIEGFDLVLDHKPTIVNGFISPGSNLAMQLQDFDGTVWVKDLVVEGPYIYDGISVKTSGNICAAKFGTGPCSNIQTTSAVQLIDVEFVHPILGLNCAAVRNAGGAIGSCTHRGGDVFHTESGHLNSLEVHNLYAEVTYQGFFLQHGPSTALFDGVVLHHPTKVANPAWGWNEFVAGVDDPGTGPYASWDVHFSPYLGDGSGTFRISTNASVDEVTFDECDVAVSEVTHTGAKSWSNYALIDYDGSTVFNGELVKSSCKYIHLTKVLTGE